MLGRLMRYPSETRVYLRALRTEDFTDARHRLIFEAIYTCDGDDCRESEWTIAVIERLRRRGHLRDDGRDAVGGPAYVIGLVEGTEAAYGPEPFPMQVRELQRYAARRLWQEACATVHTVTDEDLLAKIHFLAYAFTNLQRRLYHGE